MHTLTHIHTHTHSGRIQKKLAMEVASGEGLEDRVRGLEGLGVEGDLPSAAFDFKIFYSFK